MSENPLVGYWQLISCDALRDRGNRVPAYGRNPCGRLYYDELGNMSVHIMRSGRRANGGGAGLRAGGEGAKTGYDGYQAYFATYSVDTENRIIRHKVLGSLLPDWTGSTQVRYYELRDPDRLLLRTAPIGSAAEDQTVFELLWERIR
jgi:hypothetical protein